MKRWGLLAAGLVVYAVAIIVMAPATLFDVGVRRVSDGKLRLIEARGTLWSGSGQIEIRDATGRVGAVKSLDWRMRPESLLSGHLVCEIELDHSGKAFPVILSPSAIELANAEIGLPASALGLAVPKIAPLGLTGEMQLNVASLFLKGRQVKVKATLQWRDAGSLFTSISPLGDYELNLDGDGSTVQILLRTVQGPLQVDGKGSWAMGANPDFLAIVRVPEQHQEKLGPLLRLIAVERSTGSFELQLK